MQALLKNITLKPIEQKTRTGIELPKQYNKKQNIAEVVNVGSESALVDKIKPGQKVVFVRGAVITEVDEIYIVNEGAILALYE